MVPKLGVCFVVSLALFAQTEVHASLNNELSIHLFKNLSQNKKEKNLAFSPYAIKVAMGMAALGAKGRTLKQLGRGADPLAQKRASSKFIVANRLWVDRKFPLLNSFLDNSDKNLGLRPWMVDFSKAPDFLVDRINSWVEEKTLGKIKNSISDKEITSENRMLLSSAFYFKSDWAHSIQRLESGMGKFYSRNKELQVFTLHRSGTFPYLKSHEYQIVEIPYSDTEFVFDVIMPISKRGLEEMVKNLNLDSLDRDLNRLTSTSIHLTLPRVEFSSSIEVSESLKDIGIADPFSPQEADFSGMTGGRELYLSQFFNKTAFSITEDGSEITSSTHTLGRSPASSSHSTQLNLDHPFVFLVRHKPSHSFLVMGHVIAPPEVKNDVE